MLTGNQKNHQHFFCVWLMKRHLIDTWVFEILYVLMGFFFISVYWLLLENKMNLTTDPRINTFCWSVFAHSLSLPEYAICFFPTLCGFANLFIRHKFKELHVVSYRFMNTQHQWTGLVSLSHLFLQFTWSEPLNCCSVFDASGWISL